MSAYLESSNSDNDHRYESLGFKRIGEFSAPGGEPVVGCMWREPSWTPPPRSATLLHGYLC